MQKNLNAIFINLRFLIRSHEKGIIWIILSFQRIFLPVICLTFLTPLISEDFFSLENANGDQEFAKVSKLLSQKQYKLSGKQLNNSEKIVLDYLHLYAVEAPKIKGSEAFLRSLLDAYAKKNLEITKKALEIIVAAFPKSFTSQVLKLAKDTSDYNLLVLSALYLKKSKAFPSFLKTKLQQYPDKYHEIFQKNHLSPPLPPIEDLLWMNGDSEEWMLFAFRKPKSGFLLVRKPRGEFLRDGEKILKIPFMAKSVLQLPFYISMGDTPQGVYRIMGTTSTNNPRIGPSPVLRLGLPLEVSLPNFFPNRKDPEWSLSAVESFFPISWRGYEKLHESYHAGKNGRSGIWVHGSTLDPLKFKTVTGGTEHTLTYGCIALPEVWIEGRLKESKQRDLIMQLGNPKGYLVLVEIGEEGENELERALETKKAP